MLGKGQEDQTDAATPAGMPLGGVGAGCVEVDEGGRFCNLTFNGERGAEQRLNHVDHAWAAVSLRTGEGVYARRLQQETPEGAEPLSGLHARHLAARALYPTTHFRLNDPKAPAEITWTAFAPLIPFDHDASALPIFFVSVLVRNRGTAPIDAAVVFNWPNLIPPGAGGRAASLMPALVEYDDQPENQKLRAEATGVATTARKQELNGITFGSRQELQYCMAVRSHDTAQISLAAWDPEDASDSAHFVKSFSHERVLHGVGNFGENKAGAVCSSFPLAPGESHRCDFAFAWYAPRFGKNGTDFESAYTGRFADAVEVARHGLQHIHYFYSAVEGWQQRFTRSTLPGWFSQWLINSTSVFSTNSLAMADGSVAFFESPAVPRTARLDQRLHTSFPVLLFLPRFEETEQQLLMNADAPPGAQGLCGHLGRLTIDEPRWHDADERLVERTAILALLVYRDFCLTGKLVNLIDGYSRLLDLIELALALDKDGDGIPEHGQRTVLYDGAEVEGLNSYTAGLWIAGIRCCALIAHHQQEPKVVDRLSRLLTKASAAFDKIFWVDRLGLYSLHPASKTRGVPICHTAQLAGQWYADFLGLGALFPPARVERALATIREVCGRHGRLMSGSRLDNAPVSPGGFSEYAWPGYTAAHYCSLLIYRGKVSEGLAHLEQQHQQLRRTSLRFNQSDSWDQEKLAPAPEALERHLSSLGLWHVLYALEGFLLNVPEQRLRLWPNLPPEMDVLEAPLFTPSSFGRVKFQERLHPEYLQQITLSFDSPLRVSSLDLRVPKDFAAAQIECEVDQSSVPCSYHLSDTELGKRLLVTPGTPITLDQTVRLSIRPAKVQAEKRGLFRRR